MMESSFTDIEKRFVLAEMIKASHMDVGILVDFIKLHGIQPDWMSMQLPGGRNMNQCLRAAENMFSTPIQPPAIQPLKRRSLGDIGDHIPKKLAALHPLLGDTVPYSVPRNLGMQPTSPRQPVNIQPRPNGYAPATLPPTPGSVLNAAPTGRRRGRPPKSEVLARQAAPQMIAYQPISPAPIAPSPGPTIAPQPRSPGPGAGTGTGAGVYLLYPASSPSLPDSKQKRKGRQSAGDNQALLQSPPPGVQGAPSSEPGISRPGGVEYHDWREQATRQEQERISGPVPREPQLPPINSPLPPPRSPHPPPLGTATHARDTAAATLEQARQGSHAALVN
ncbi:hypothetical protein B0T24DRAFT_169725 [Lasiosphaeria ovina]|uniref:Uncharacterized protein n=1 Tax=Lasiosphaeria ovina TaxID=92902 RepID=A0AAE0NE41_9PEZI|nr:hypothetical protein B0T24DRAFT_169725 [Lasiosphaeria ovina]